MLTSDQIAGIQNFLQNKGMLGNHVKGEWDLTTARCYVTYAIYTGLDRNKAQQQPTDLSQLPAELQDALAGVMSLSEDVKTESTKELSSEEEDAAEKALDEMADANSTETTDVSDEELAALAAEANASTDASFDPASSDARDPEVAVADEEIETMKSPFEQSSDE
jgi:hypothetical protein